MADVKIVELGEELVSKGGRKKGEDNFVVVGYSDEKKEKEVIRKSFFSDVVNVNVLSAGELKKVNYRAYRIGKVDNVDKDGWKDVVAIRVFKKNK